MVSLVGRSFLTLKDFTPEEIMYMIDLAADLKDKKKKGISTEYCKGKNVDLIFEKTSKRKTNKGKTINIKKLKKYINKKSVKHMFCNMNEMFNYYKYFIKDRRNWGKKMLVIWHI